MIRIITALLSLLRLDRSIRLGAVVRRSDAVVPDGVETVVMQALLDADTRRDQPQPLAGVRAILHCAERVHVMQDAAADPVAEYRRVNVDLTLALARMAAAAGVPQCKQ